MGEFAQGGISHSPVTRTSTMQNLAQTPVMTSMMKASLKMIGISIVLLITFLCLALPGLLFYPTKNIADFPHYVFIWKLTMWVFLVSPPPAHPHPHQRQGAEGEEQA